MARAQHMDTRVPTTTITKRIWGANNIKYPAYLFVDASICVTTEFYNLNSINMSAHWASKYKNIFTTVLKSDFSGAIFPTNRLRLFLEIGHCQKSNETRTRACQSARAHTSTHSPPARTWCTHFVVYTRQSGPTERTCPRSVHGSRNCKRAEIAIRCDDAFGATRVSSAVKDVTSSMYFALNNYPAMATTAPTLPATRHSAKMDR